ncbi:MAG: glutamate racemase [Pseudomonadota bacterium]
MDKGPADNAPIGVFDSGIGGLSVLRALCEELPTHDFVYLADSAHAPYGERDPGFVLARSQAAVDYLRSKGVRALVVACNTATAAAIDALRVQYPDMALIGVEPAIKPALALSRTGHIGVLATRGTLQSPRFEALMAPYASKAKFTLVPCDGLALAIETGNDAEIRRLCEAAMADMGPVGAGAGEVDTLVLGCTHYPFAQAHLLALAGPDVTLIDNGPAVARQTRVRLPVGVPGSQVSPLHERMGQITLLATGDATGLQAAAQRWLKRDLRAAELQLAGVGAD